MDLHIQGFVVPIMNLVMISAAQGKKPHQK